MVQGANITKNLTIYSFCGYLHIFFVEKTA